jgi:hypothetical protein
MADRMDDHEFDVLMFYTLAGGLKMLSAYGIHLSTR